jgi:hypothetical protein
MARADDAFSLNWVSIQLALASRTEDGRPESMVIPMKSTSSWKNAKFSGRADCEATAGVPQKS